jgi:serine/threonine protein kinase
MTFAQPFQDYEILDRVGAGAMGTVFKARQKRLSRIVALKVLRPSLARDTRYVDRLRREARIVAALNHPHIVSGYDLGEEGGYHFFVMEFVEGKSLKALLAEWGMFAEARVLEVGIQVARALDHAFQRGVIHRDVKPGNILIDEQGNVKLTDMGLAKGPADLTLTRDGATVGTPQYISPEQARNPQDVDVRSDLYSLGATLYHMATGQPPFKGDTMAAVITKVLHEVPPAPRDLNPALSEGLSLVIRKLLAKNLALRYQTPRELLDDLDRVQKAMPPAVDESRLVAGETGPQPSAVKATLVALLACAVVAGAVWLGTYLRGDGAASPTPDAFLADLEQKLGSLPTLRDRWLRLVQAEAAAPTGSLSGLQAQRRRIQDQLEESVGSVVAELQGEHWPQTQAWLENPERWPAMADFEREKLGRLLRDRTGFLVEQLPQSVDRAAIVALRTQVEQALRVRDGGLRNRATRWIEETLPGSAAERVGNGDYAAAEKLWSRGLTGFFDGLQVPRLERLSDPAQKDFEKAFKDARDAALTDLAKRERAKAEELRDTVHEGIADLRARLKAGGNPELVAKALERLHQDVTQSFPDRTRFRLDVDPWPQVDIDCQSFGGEVRYEIDERDKRHLERVLDLAWRAFCAGGDTSALGLLHGLGGDDDQRRRVAEHERAILAGAHTADAMVRALALGPAVPGHRRNGPVEELSAVQAADGWRLLATVAGGEPRTAHVTEFAFADLWGEVLRRKPQLDVPPAELELGRAVLAMVGDELGAAGSALQPGAAAPAPMEFLRDVYERIVRVRREADGGALAFVDALRTVDDAFTRAKTSQDHGLRDLDAALAVFGDRLPQAATAEDRAHLSGIREWRDAERNRQHTRDLVRSGAPKGARVETSPDGADIKATVMLEGEQLQALATDSWTLNHETGLLEFPGVAAQRCDEMVRGRLGDIGSGLPATVLRSTCEIELVLPPASRGQRLYVFDFRGVGFLLLITADNFARAVTIEGDPRKEEAVHAAAARVLGAPIERELRSLAPGDDPRARVVPGALHRVWLTLDLSPGGRESGPHNAVAKVLLDPKVERGGRIVDGDVLCKDMQVEVDPARLPNLVIYPLQAMQLRAVVFVGSGL